MRVQASRLRSSVQPVNYTLCEDGVYRNTANKPTAPTTRVYASTPLLPHATVHHYTIVCKKQYTHITTTLAAPLHCTCCHTTRAPKVQPSLASEPTLDYNISPIIARTLTQLLNHYNADPTNTRKLTFNQYVESKLHMTRQPITPLHVHCHQCGSTFTLLRSDPTTHKSPPKHCIYCTSTQLSILQATTDDTAYICLAEHYSLPLNHIQYLYKFWSSRPNYPTFDSFMQSDTMAQLRPVLDSIANS